jgi:hypothetical protein
LSEAAKLGYSSVSDIRVLTGISADVLSDSEVESLIVYSDQQINDEIQTFSSPIPARIRHLSALLTAIKVFSSLTQKSRSLRLLEET